MLSAELRYRAAKAPGGLIEPEKYKVLGDEFLEKIRAIIEQRIKIGICFFSTDVDDLFFTYEICSELARQVSFHHMYATSASDGIAELRQRDDLNVYSPVVVSGFGLEVNNYKERNAIETLIYERFVSRSLTVVIANVPDAVIKEKYQPMISQIIFKKYYGIR